MKTLIFYAKAGGGHESAARAIQTSLQKDPNNQVKIVDIFSTSSNFTQWTFNQAYILMITKLNWLWKIVCYLWAFMPFFRLNFWITKKSSNSLNLIKDEVENFKPDLILTTYFSLDKWIKEVLKQQNLKIPVASTIVDIFSPHSAWFLEPDTNYAIFSKEAKAVAEQNGVNPNKITVFKPFFDDKFETEIDSQEKTEVYKNFNLNPNFKTLMFSGGGVGIPKTLPILKEFFNSNLTNLNLILICGRNESLKKEVDSFAQKNNKELKAKNLNIITTGFTDQIHKLTSISDLVLTKAGPATVFEILAMKKPMLIAHYIWPQEEGNVDFVLKNKYGIYEPEPDKIVKKVESLFSDSNKLTEFNKNLSQTNFSSGMTDLIKYFNEIVKI
jgi:UDP-N-acetylglucosamine:LPS N-acetylglucosamine transferase